MDAAGCINSLVNGKCLVTEIDIAIVEDAVNGHLICGQQKLRNVERGVVRHAEGNAVAAGIEGIRPRPGSET